MRVFITSQVLSVICLTFMLSFGYRSFAGNASKADSISQKSSQWHPTERQVPRGDKIKELSEGSPLAAFSPGGDKEKELDDFIRNQKVAGLLVIHDGKIRLERYALGHTDTSLWSSLSVAKSVTSTLVGVAIKDGYIKSIDDYVTDYLPDLKGSAFDSVKIRHLLTMTSGIKWNENYTDPNSDIARFDNDTTADGMKAIVSYMRRLPAEAEPGTKFNYSTGETHLLGTLISAATKQSLAHYLSTKIWIPYGMEHTATWRVDRTGQELAGCCLQMRLRDFGRFGQFVLEDGYINDESIVPDNWFQEATKIQIPLWPGGGYGYGWWIFNNHSFEALGIHGQKIYIDPSRKLVIAINSAWPEADSNERHFAVAKFINSVAEEIDKE
ncbi:serine hydrolase domain-containing protein [Thermophagus xiamenensis]|uniref:CubicO group peptidase, beta-lactamase class C family n=1 Tax=Thermophagus xiamenensis TaxID=385682 RepID=A0A1I2F3J1_9BACT|nr:serine hydrolase [Thermophagus xiamenensis]SFE99755.1 CubicO group peptidase, beta-lactamase class C family [Thermophagus xiamenensis]